MVFASPRDLFYLINNTFDFRDQKEKVANAKVVEIWIMI